MRVERVVAHGFGPLADAELELAPGLSIVHGPNESGKSSWHAALFTALTGRRRGKGLRKEDKSFRDRYEPWDGRRWQVSAVVALDEGRRIELHHDLEGKVDCSATDLTLGRDVSAEIMNDGAPDASRWLGLDRRGMAATACISQAQMLSVLDSADDLQEHLQRATATAGSDSTAAAALDAINDFRRVNVGRDTAASSRPLRMAKSRLDDAREQLTAAIEHHETYVREVEHAHALHARADRLNQELAECDKQRAALINLQTASRHAAQAAAAGDRAAQLAEAAQSAVDVARARRDRAAELHHRSGGTKPPDLTRQDAIARSVAHALAAWGAAPEPRTLHGPGSAELERELHQLPEMPRGDQVVADDVSEAYSRYDKALAALHTHDQRDQRDGDVRTTRAVSRGVAGVAAAATIALVLFGQPMVAVASGVLAALGATFGAVVGVRHRSRRISLSSTVDTLTNDVRDLVAKRDPEATGRDVAELMADYRRLCASRQTTAMVASQRDELTHAFHSRRRDEEQAAHVNELRQHAIETMRRAALSAGLPAHDSTEPDQLASALEEWEQDWQHTLEAMQDRQRAWSQLTEVLAGMSIDDLSAHVEGEEQAACVAQDQHTAAMARAREAARVRDLAADAMGIPRSDAAEDELLDKHLQSLAVEIRELHSEHGRVSGEARQVEGALAERARTMPSVPEARETFDAAEAELERVQRLARTLDLTESFLQHAQERIHRSVAPVLAESLRTWLPRITAGRYADAVVDPADLHVQVCGVDRRWRDADKLSVGTCEQIYLLLRVALAQHLTTAGERCPLFLDDVLVQADEERTTQLLELLLALAGERQIVLFAQDQKVADWARTRLITPEHRLIELEPVAG